MRGKRLLFKTFSMLDRAGVHVMPKHYYTPVPDCACLKDNESLWIGRNSLTGCSPTIVPRPITRAWPSLPRRQDTSPPASG